MYIISESRYPSVHPHVCGELCAIVKPDVSQAGSSPRLWGTRGFMFLKRDQVRFIPTSVGNSHHVPGDGRDQPVHPHVCGELGLGYNAVFFRNGSSPRLWGTHPRRRLKIIQSRFIPTSVGNSNDLRNRDRRRAVHPHVCGELHFVPLSKCEKLGSSPRLWGTLSSGHSLALTLRFIPTSVGNSIFEILTNVYRPVHPHVCGELISLAIKPAR